LEVKELVGYTLSIECVSELFASTGGLTKCIEVYSSLLKVMRFWTKLKLRAQESVVGILTGPFG